MNGFDDYRTIASKGIPPTLLATRTRAHWATRLPPFRRPRRETGESHACPPQVPEDRHGPATATRPETESRARAAGKASGTEGHTSEM